jgi:hypothetical protein
MNRGLAKLKNFYKNVKDFKIEFMRVGIEYRHI